MLRCPNEILARILKYVVANVAGGELYDRKVLLLVCKQFAGQVTNAENLGVEDIAAASYALAAAIRPHTTAEVLRKGGLLTNWLPDLHKLCETSLQTVDDEEAKLAIAGMYVVDMLYRLDLSAIISKPNAIAALPVWCLRLVRIATIQMTTVLFNGNDSVLSIFVQLFASVCTPAGQAQAVVAIIQVPVIYAAIESYLLESSITGVLPTFVDYAVNTSPSIESWQDIFSTTAFWNLQAFLEYIIGLWRVERDQRALPGDDNMIPLRGKAGARLDLVITKKLEDAGHTGYPAADVGAYFEDLKDAVQRELGDVGEYALAGKLKELRAMLLEEAESKEADA